MSAYPLAREVPLARKHRCRDAFATLSDAILGQCPPPINDSPTRAPLSGKHREVEHGQPLTVCTLHGRAPRRAFGHDHRISWSHIMTKLATLYQTDYATWAQRRPSPVIARRPWPGRVPRRWCLRPVAARAAREASNCPLAWSRALPAASSWLVLTRLRCSSDAGCVGIRRRASHAQVRDSAAARRARALVDRFLGGPRSN